MFTAAARKDERSDMVVRWALWANWRHLGLGLRGCLCLPPSIKGEDVICIDRQERRRLYLSLVSRTESPEPRSSQSTTLLESNVLQHTNLE
jgi:hypothetical protein